MFWDRISNSWEYAKMSYRILWDHKKLLVLPIISAIAAGLVSASFILPLAGSGRLDAWLNAVDENASGQLPPQAYITLFLFYFCNYFVIVFFNSALIACTMRVLEDRTPRLGEGLKFAAKRWHAILGWAVVSATVGIILRMIEQNRRVGEIVSAVLGTAWTAMTYFVVPAIVIEDAGPFKAIKRSLGTLRHTWGEALLGNFSLGFISLLIFLPIILLAGLLFWWAFSAGSLAVIVLAVVLGGGLLALAAAAGSAADVVFKGILYSYANDRTLPQSLDRSSLDLAFVQKNAR